jgi:hypothetical protein
MEIDNPPIPPLEKGGWGDLIGIFYVIQHLSVGYSGKVLGKLLLYKGLIMG